MRYPLLLCAILMAPAVQAWDCKYELEIDQTLDLADSQTLSISAAAGDLEIEAGGNDQASIRGKLCASKEEWLRQAKVLTEGGTNAEIVVDLPEASGWSVTGNQYVYLDLEVTVPDDIAVDVKDSSGDADISGLMSLDVVDSSGDLEIRDISGPVTLRDSSGDIELVDIRGDVTVVSDSSGDIDGNGISGAVLIEKDSSGKIDFVDVSGDFTVEKDSSGDIIARDVGGNFTVLRDGSGSIQAKNVSGTITKPENS